MAIRKMKKLSLVALRSDAEKLVRDLTYIRSVELKPIDTPPDGLPAVLPAPVFSTESSEKKLLVDTALKLTEKYRTKKKPDTELDRTQLEDKERHVKAIDAARRVLEVDSEMKRLASEKEEVGKKLLALAPWEGLGINPASPDTAYTRTVIGVVQQSVSFDEKFSGDDMPDVYAEVVSSAGSRNYVSVTYLKTDESRVATQLARLGFTRIELDKAVTCASVSIKALNDRNAAIDAESERLREELRSLAGYSDEFKLLYDSYSLDESVEETANGLFYTSGAVLVQGWVPEHKIQTLEETLGKFECFYQLDDPKDDEEPPVLLKNGPITAPFESILALYAYPKYRAFDPTPFVAFFFCFIFGFMMQDMGYGLVLLIGCLAMIKIAKPRGTFRQMLKMFAMCGVSTIFAGALFGGFFGDLPSSFSQNMLGKGAVDISLWFSPLDNPMKMLYFSLAVGVIQVLTGIAISGYVKCKNGDVYGAFADDFCWLFIFIGGGLWFALSGVASTIALGVALAGVLMILLMSARGVKNPILRIGKGLIGLYGAINLASDILSYSRIMALSLSGVVIANVMNLLGTIAGPTPAGIILFVFMLVIGTALNLAISLLGAFVHSARLQYIEFFGKFYDEGGIPFNPLRPAEKYYVIK